jgi:WhiB family redox-sensing transcriptional regulator
VSTDWLSEAACKGMDADTFFPGQGGDTSYPKSVCAICPVSDPCKDHAVIHEPRGVWGGTTDRERRKVRQSQGIRLVRPESMAFLAECGSPAAYRRHLREGSPIDDICRRAHNERQWTYKSRQQEKEKLFASAKGPS